MSIIRILENFVLAGGLATIILVGRAYYGVDIANETEAPPGTLTAYCAAWLVAFVILFVGNHGPGNQGRDD